MTVDNDRAFHGLDLYAYARVYAAIAEGFPLEIVLENAGIPGEAWQEIDAAWADALAADVDDGGTLGAELDRALLELQERYRRSIPPLDEDVEAWACFVRAWSRAPEPAAFLKQRGLEPNDLLRLHRRWSRELEADPQKRSRVLAILAKDDVAAPAMKRPQPLELHGPIRVGSGTRRLPGPLAPPDGTPSLFAQMPEPDVDGPVPMRPKAPATGIEDGVKTVLGAPALEPTDDMPPLGEPIPPEGSSPFDSLRLPDGFELPPPSSITVVPLSEEMTLAQYASYRAELDACPEDEQMICARYGLADAERRTRIDESWLRRLQEETETYAEWRALYRHFSEHWTSLKR
jgi:hypothetical protein